MSIKRNKKEIIAIDTKIAEMSNYSFNFAISNNQLSAIRNIFTNISVIAFYNNVYRICPMIPEYKHTSTEYIIWLYVDTNMPSISYLNLLKLIKHHEKL